MWTVVGEQLIISAWLNLCVELHAPAIMSVQVYSWSEFLGFIFSPGTIEGLSASFSSCTVTYVDGSASVSCVDTTSSGYQVILLQDNDPYNLTVVNVTPGEKQTVPVVPSGRYCIMELSIQDSNDSEVKYSREFTAEKDHLDATTLSYTVDGIGIASKSTLSD